MEYFFVDIVIGKEYHVFLGYFCNANMVVIIDDVNIDIGCNNGYGPYGLLYNWYMYRYIDNMQW